MYRFCTYLNEFNKEIWKQVNIFTSIIVKGQDVFIQIENELWNNFNQCPDILIVQSCNDKHEYAYFCMNIIFIRPGLWEKINLENISPYQGVV